MTIRDTDDMGQVSGTVWVGVPAGASKALSVAQLERGSPEFAGALGDGVGDWHIEMEAADSRGNRVAVMAMSLVENPGGHLANLSRAPDVRGPVPMFLGAGNASGREGLLRVVNRSDRRIAARIVGYDDEVKEHGARPVEPTREGRSATRFQRS